MTLRGDRWLHCVVLDRSLNHYLSSCDHLQCILLLQYSLCTFKMVAPIRNIASCEVWTMIRFIFCKNKLDQMTLIVKLSWCMEMTLRRKSRTFIHQWQRTPPRPTTHLNPLKLDGSSMVPDGSCWISIVYHHIWPSSKRF